MEGLAGLGIEYRAPCDLTKEALAPASIDFIHSVSTFEHVPVEAIQPILETLREALTPGGVMAHSIHLADHRDIDDAPFAFLAEDTDWRPDQSDARGDRLRVPDWKDIVTRLDGLALVRFKATREERAPLPARLAPQFRDLPQDVLRTDWLQIAPQAERPTGLKGPPWRLAAERLVACQGEGRHLDSPVFENGCGVAGLFTRFRAKVHAATKPAPDEPVTRDWEREAIQRYLAGPRIPFSDGYTEYKEQTLRDILTDGALMQRFASGAALPAGHGARLDERIVEYPWALSRLPPDGLIVDAGSTFNKATLLATEQLKQRKILVYTLETDWITYDPRLSYVFGDLRDMVLKDDVASSVVCISTLEHVGFTYEYTTYSRRNPWPLAEPESYLKALAEFKRVLAPGGRLLLTVPFGRREDHGWLQQFDAAMIAKVKAAFGGNVAAEVYYRYHSGAWNVADPAKCSGLSYFNIHETGGFEEDGLAAARAVACLDLVK